MRAYVERIRARILALIRDHPPDMEELVSGAFAASWGCTWMLPADTFQTAATYQILVALGLPEWLWGLLLAILGFGQIAVCLLTIHVRRRRAATAMAGVWGFLGTMFFVANPATAGLWTCLILSMMNGWVFSRLGHRSQEGVRR